MKKAILMLLVISLTLLLSSCNKEVNITNENFCEYTSDHPYCTKDNMGNTEYTKYLFEKIVNGLSQDEHMYYCDLYLTSTPSELCHDGELDIITTNYHNLDMRDEVLRSGNELEYYTYFVDQIDQQVYRLDITFKDDDGIYKFSGFEVSVYED